MEQLPTSRIKKFSFGGPLLFHCGYDIKDTLHNLVLILNRAAPVLGGFSSRVFHRETIWHNILWKNKDIDNRPIFYKTFFESVIRHANDFRLYLNITESYNIITKKIKKANI